LLHILLF